MLVIFLISWVSDALQAKIEDFDYVIFMPALHDPRISRIQFSGVYYGYNFTYYVSATFYGIFLNIHYSLLTDVVLISQNLLDLKCN